MMAAEAADARLRAEGGLGALSVGIGSSAVQQRQMQQATAGPTLTDRAIQARRRDELVARRAGTAQQVQDYEGELRRLEQDHREIVRPDSRLWWGIVIVVVFAVVGVALPLWEMSLGARSLASVRWLFWPFTGSLVLLVGYIVVYLAQITHRK
jgi:hypothetical protein